MSGENRADTGHAQPKTYGEQVGAGVARAALLDCLLREPRVTAALDALAAIAGEPSLDVATDRTSALLARAVMAAQQANAVRALRLDRMTLHASELGLTWIGPWLPEFLVAAAIFRGTVEAEDLRNCTLVDARLAPARATVRAWRAEAATSRWIRPDPVMRLLAALLPATEPADWVSRPPDWIELFTILVEHAAVRRDWTREATGADRLWPYLLLRSELVWDVEPGDDPEVLHGLVDLWAARSRATVDADTKSRLPRGLVPGNSGVYKDGRPREGRRDKLRRWVGWYVAREIRQIPLNEILRAAYPNSAAPLERSSEVRRHISDARQLLALDLPLDAGQAARLWKLAEANRDLLELPLSDRG